MGITGRNPPRVRGRTAVPSPDDRALEQPRITEIETRGWSDLPVRQPDQKTDKTDTFSPIYMWSGNSLFSIHGVSYGVSHSREGISTVCVTRPKTVSFVRLPADLRKQGTVVGWGAQQGCQLWSPGR